MGRDKRNPNNGGEGMGINLTEMMTKEGWVLGYSVNWNVKYWSFRKGDIEVSMNDFNVFWGEDDEDHKHFKHWREDSPNLNNKTEDAFCDKYPENITSQSHGKVTE